MSTAQTEPAPTTTESTAPSTTEQVTTTTESTTATTTESTTATTIDTTTTTVEEDLGGDAGGGASWLLFVSIGIVLAIALTWSVAHRRSRRERRAQWREETELTLDRAAHLRHWAASFVADTRASAGEPGVATARSLVADVGRTRGELASLVRRAPDHASAVVLQGVVDAVEDLGHGIELVASAPPSQRADQLTLTAHACGTLAEAIGRSRAG